jgi:mRNA interferase MazF
MPLMKPLRRGDMIRVRLDPVEGSEQAGERPVLVISPDLINAHSPVILVAAITSRKTDRVYPFEVLLAPGEAGLPQRSKVLFMQLRAIDTRRVTEIYGSITPEIMAKVEDALKIAVGLTPL